ncbi:hypothetical protein Mapa_000392 [Marchantia paleacea]|nr:hypothetical protein Mapa_000392 [Marchantia paleacea]
METNGCHSERATAGFGDGGLETATPCRIVHSLLLLSDGADRRVRSPYVRHLSNRSGFLLKRCTDRENYKICRFPCLVDTGRRPVPVLLEELVITHTRTRNFFISTVFQNHVPLDPAHRRYAGFKLRHASNQLAARNQGNSESIDFHF